MLPDVQGSVTFASPALKCLLATPRIRPCFPGDLPHFTGPFLPGPQVWIGKEGTGISLLEWEAMPSNDNTPQPKHHHT